MTPAGLAQLKIDEGCVLFGYPDPRSPLGQLWKAVRPQTRATLAKLIDAHPGVSAKPWTVGVGCTGHDATGAPIGPDTVWTQEKADAELLHRVAGFERDLASALPWIHTLNDVRQDVLTNMSFNLGVEGLLGFHDTLGLIRSGHYDEAADHMLKSLWARQVGDRAKRLADKMRRAA